jgi:hypothetical protein
MSNSRIHPVERVQMTRFTSSSAWCCPQLKDNEEVRPPSANRNTIKAMERRGLISPGNGRDPLTIVWRLKKKIT